MTNSSIHLGEKSRHLGIPEEFIATALNIISQNKNLVNAMDHTGEMDDYIYRAILKQAFEKRKQQAESALYTNDDSVQREAERELTMLRREELTSDAFYRAVLPLMVKVLHGEPILRLHAEEASRVVLQLADCKRKHRSTSITEVIVKKCVSEIEAYS
jgi:hypothetical protein